MWRGHEIQARDLELLDSLLSKGWLTAGAGKDPGQMMEPAQMQCLWQSIAGCALPSMGGQPRPSSLCSSF